MLKIGFTSLFLFSIFFSFSQLVPEEEFDHHCYVSEGTWAVGFGSPYSYNLSLTGLNTRIYYNLAEDICFGLEYSYFKDDHIEVMDLDLIGHYIFETPWVGIFPLIGANYTVEIESQVEEEIETAVGVVFGAGVHRNYKKITIFAEYSRVEWGIADEFFTMGFLYNFK